LIDLIFIYAMVGRIMLRIAKPSFPHLGLADAASRARLTPGTLAFLASAR
jgi:hypothetical protein